MWYLALGVPAVMWAVLAMLGWLEDRLVAPVERAQRITDLLERASSPEEVEREVTRMLAVAIPSTRRSPARILWF